MRYLGCLLVLSLACAATGPTSQPPPRSAAETIGHVVNVGACVAGDVAPEVRRDVDSLIGGSLGTAERVIGGIIAAGGALARSYACYLRDAATVRAQAEGGEVAAASRDEVTVIKSRAESCPLSADTCKAPAAAARLLLVNVAAGRVTLPEKPACVPLTDGRPLREGETLCR